MYSKIMAISWEHIFRLGMNSCYNLIYLFMNLSSNKNDQLLEHFLILTSDV